MWIDVFIQKDRRAEKAIASAKPITLYEVHTPEGIWYTDQEEVDAGYLLALVGINQDCNVFLVENNDSGRPWAKLKN